MAKYEPKTKVTHASVEEFIETSDPTKREDSYKLLAMMQEITGCSARDKPEVSHWCL